MIIQYKNQAAPQMMKCRLCYCVNCGEFLQQFLDFCFEVFDLGGTLYQVVATIDQEEIGHGLNVVKHQAL